MKTLAFILSMFLVFLVLFTGSPSVIARDKPPPSYQSLLSKIEQGGTIRVIVKLNVPFQPEGYLESEVATAQRRAIYQAQNSLVSALSGYNATRLFSLQYIPYVVLEVDYAALRFLETQPQVISVVEDLPLSLFLKESTHLIGSDIANAKGYVGAGQTVAILDTGIEATHSFFSDENGDSRVVGEACFSINDPTTGISTLCPNGNTVQYGPGAAATTGRCPPFACWHGIHVAGIAAGNGHGKRANGVAPASNIMAVQISYRDGNEVKPSLSTMIAGLNYVYSMRNTYNIAAVNLSAGSTILFNQPCDTNNQYQALKDVIDLLRSVGIATVAAAGNGGNVNGIASPACLSNTISVGATADNADQIASFSNSAYFLDILAPGVTITSSVAHGWFWTLDGTSLATPHVTGAWALLKSAYPNATVDEILTVLQKTGRPIVDTRPDPANNNIPINRVTPRIQVDTALDYLADLPSQIGPPYKIRGVLGTDKWYLEPTDGPPGADVIIRFLEGGHPSPTRSVGVCEEWPLDARNAFEYAVDRWSRSVTSTVPIVIDACWEPLISRWNILPRYWFCSTECGQILGQSRPTIFVKDFPGAPKSGIWYPIALANALSGNDMAPMLSDIQISMNNHVAWWYFGTDGNPPRNRYDFATAAMQGIGYSLGFAGTMTVTSDDPGVGKGHWGLGTSSLPTIYDVFTVNKSGDHLIGPEIKNNSIGLWGELMEYPLGQQIFFSGPNANQANNNLPVRLFGPIYEWGWQPYGGPPTLSNNLCFMNNVSFSSLNDQLYGGDTLERFLTGEHPDDTPNALMTPSLSWGEAIHSPGPIILGILQDLGWSVQMPTQSPDIIIYPPEPPPNDDFDHAILVGELPFGNAQETGLATSAADDPHPSCWDVGGNVWYRYTAPSDGHVRFETTNSDYDTWLAVLTGTRGHLTEVACNDDVDSGPQSRVDLPVTAGTTYHFLIGGDDGESGILVFTASTMSGLVEHTLGPTDDTYVKAEYPNSNYNGQDYLRVRRTRSYDNDAYLKFDLSGLAGTIQRATLRLYAYDGSDDGGSVYAVANTYRDGSIPWTETGLTWNNAPLFGGTPIASAGAVPNGTWVEFDVTAAVTGPGIYSFAVSNESYRSIFFYAKEAGSYPPELVVETHVVPPSFGPTDDTYVKSEYPKSNYGGQDYLRVRRTRSYDNNAYLKFDLNSLSGTVQRATLRLYAYDGSDDGGAVYTVADTYWDSSIPWTEAGLTWNNAPPILGAPLDSVGKVTDNTWVEFDVTAAITGPGIYSFAISNESYRSIFFYAKEAGQYPPELVIDVGENSFEETHPAWTWQGSWLPYSQAGASGGMVFSYAATPPAPIDTYAEFSFTAAGFTLYYHKSPAGGIANLFIDDMATPYAQIDMYADHDQWLEEAILHVEGLDPAVTHTLRVVPTGDKNLLSTGYVISIDRLDLLDATP